MRATGIPDESTHLVDQFAAWIETGSMRSRDGPVTYSVRLAEVFPRIARWLAERSLA